MKILSFQLRVFNSFLLSLIDVILNLYHQYITFSLIYFGGLNILSFNHSVSFPLANWKSL